MPSIIAGTAELGGNDVQRAPGFTGFASTGKSKAEIEAAIAKHPQGTWGVSGTGIARAERLPDGSWHIAVDRAPTQAAPTVTRPTAAPIAGLQAAAPDTGGGSNVSNVSGGSGFYTPTASAEGADQTVLSGPTILRQGMGKRIPPDLTQVLQGLRQY